MKIVGPPLHEAAEVIKDTLLHGFHKPDDSSWDPRDLDLNYLMREFLVDEPPKLRLSFGKECPRFQWYAHNEPEKATHRGAMRRRHVSGHLFEYLALWVLEHHLPEPWSLDTSWAQKTVHTFNLEGHTDGALLYAGEPYALLDCKETQPFVFKHWPLGRFPDPKWGYPYQAANYMRAAREEGVHFRGFLWPVGILGEPDRYECGWADHTELLEYETRAETIFRDAQTLKNPPPPIHPARDESPCARWRNKTKGIRKNYCEFIHHCEQDER